MGSLNNINEAWKTGYINGYKEITGKIPSIPPRPSSVPAGIFNQIEYFYQKGYVLGREDGQNAR